MKMLTIAIREMKLGFRNPWAYSFMAVFTLFSAALLLIQAQNRIQGYTASTGTMLHLILYLLPLMALLIGSFAVTSEKEDGGWQLLSSYSLSTVSYLLGKYIGLMAVLFVIISFGYGLSGLLGAFAGKMMSFATFGLFIFFSVALLALFLAVAIWIGSLSRNRWQALSLSVSVWFFFILAWPTLLIALLGSLPYMWIKSALVGLTFLNPAELVRLFMVVKMGGGSVLGPEYYEWIGWIRRPAGTAIFFLISAVWIGVMLGLSMFKWERGRNHA